MGESVVSLVCEEGEWYVKTEKGTEKGTKKGSKKGEKEGEYRFDYCVVCTGMYSTPHFPPGAKGIHRSTTVRPGSGGLKMCSQLT